MKQGATSNGLITRRLRNSRGVRYSGFSWSYVVKKTQLLDGKLRTQVLNTSSPHLQCPFDTVHEPSEKNQLLSAVLSNVNGVGCVLLLGFKM